MINKADKDKNKILFPVLSAALSILLFLAIVCLQKIAPFGERAYLLWDTIWQYSAFDSWFSEVLHGNAYFWYSLRGELGMSTAGLFAYYLVSPLNLLFYFFNEKTIMYGILLISLIKTGLSAATMQYYLYTKRQDYISVIFGCFYALSSFAVSFGYNLMWMDAYYMLPLTIYGIDQLLEAKKGIKYSVFLAYALMCNYYIGFMLCIFCVIYFLCMLPVSHAGASKKDYLMSVKDFLIHSVLGGGVSFVILLPGALSLMESSTNRLLSIKDFFDFSFVMDNPINGLRYILAGGFDKEQGILGRYPMVYSGIMVLVAFFAFFISKKISERKKLCYAIAFAILLIGMVFNGPFLIWHGFNIPSGCYERFAFLWVFLAIAVGYEAFTDISIKNKKLIAIVYAIVLAIIVYVLLSNSFRIIYVLNLFLVTAVVISTVAYNSIGNTKTKLIVFVGILFISAIELVYNGNRIYEVQYTDEYILQSKYLDDIDNYERLSAFTTNYDRENQRAVIVHGLGDSFNRGLLYNNNGIEIYASSETLNAWNIYGNLGIGSIYREDQQEFDDHANGLIRNILGVKYIYDYYFKDYPGTNELATSNDISIYENEHALPLAFLVNEKAIGVENESNLIDRMNRIYHSLYGALKDDAYSIVEHNPEIKNQFAEFELALMPRLLRVRENIYTDGEYLIEENTDVINLGSDNCASKTLRVEVNGRHISCTIDNPENESMYVCFSLSNDDSFSATIDGVKTDVLKGMGGLTLVKIPNGTHDIKLTHHTKGLTAGVVISIISIILLITITYIGKRTNEA